MSRRSFLGMSGIAMAAVLAGCSSSTTQSQKSQEEIELPVETVAAGPAANLTVNGLTNPLGIPVDNPVFGWRINSDVQRAAQKSYQLVVQDASGNTVWDSGTVNGAACQNIAYGGPALSPQSRYTWKVSVPDADGNLVESEQGLFSTGLADGTYDQWANARWIGSQHRYFDAAVTNYFNLEATLTIPEGSTRAGVVLGADDFRLKNPAMNIWGSETTSSFVYEIDVTDPAAPKLNIYVHGIPAFEAQNGGDDSQPAYVVDIASDVIAEADVHSPITIAVATPTNINALTCSINGQAVDENRQINPLGATGDYNSFPNVASIGFEVPAGQTASYQNVALHSMGKNEEKYDVEDLFGESVGATYAIFQDLEGVTVDGNTITVEGGANGTLAFADPSFGSAPMLRSEFNAKGNVASATLYAAAQGIYEIAINGQQVTDGFFNPGCEEYEHYMPYRTYNVTSLLTQGQNAIGAQLAEGWWSGAQSYTITNWDYYGAKQALLAMLDVTYEDGSTDTFVTDPSSWKVYDAGPVRAASYFNGERYDATVAAAMSGWSEPGYDDSAWSDPAVLEPRMNDFSFVPRFDCEGHVSGELTATACLGEAKAGTGSVIYDMGENVNGVPQITVPAGMASAGDTIILRYAEVLYPDLPEYREAGTVGMMMVENLRAAMDVDFYVATGKEQVIEPHFTYRGYRYVEITGLNGQLPLQNVKLLRLSTIDTTSTYEGSNPLANRLFLNVQNSERSNFLSLPTDCPQRNERMGWTGDAQVFSIAASYNADVYNIYREWLRMLRAEQRFDGRIPVFAPTFEATPASAEEGGMTWAWQGISWDAALMVIPYNMWQMTGNTAILADNVDAWETYLSYLEANPMIIPTGDDPNVGDTVSELTNETGFLADWLSIDQTDASLINNAVYVYILGISAEMEGALGRTDQQKKYSDMHDAAKAKWNELYFDASSGKTVAPAVKTLDPTTYNYVVAPASDQDTEASYATPLAYGVFSDENVQAAVDGLAAAVGRANHTITSGFSGTPFLVPMLTKYDRTSDAYQLFEQEDYASWLYPVVNGATSVWERWNSYTVENGFGGNNSMNSFDHFSLGAISQWMMEYHLGITHDEPGFQQFVLQPVAGGDFTNAGGSYESPYGTIESSWQADNDTMTSYHCVVPANTAATLYLQVDESLAQGLALPEGATYTGMNDRNGVSCATFSLAAGTYDFDLTA